MGEGEGEEEDRKAICEEDEDEEGGDDDKNFCLAKPISAICGRISVSEHGHGGGHVLFARHPQIDSPTIVVHLGSRQQAV